MDERKFYFIEVNQVSKLEHTVTEEFTASKITSQILDREG